MLPLTYKNLRLQFSLAIAIAIALLSGIYAVVNVMPLWHDTPLAEAQISHTRRSTPESISTDIDAIHAMNLFGVVAAPAPVDPSNIPITPLNLKLVGVFESTISQTSRALIMDAGKPTQTYYVGDELPGSAKLNQIQKDFVIIEHGDKLEKLELHAAAIASTIPSRHFGTLPAIAASAPASTLTPAANTHTNTTPNTSVATIQTVYKELENRLAAIRQAKQ